MCPVRSTEMVRVKPHARRRRAGLARRGPRARGRRLAFRARRAGRLLALRRVEGGRRAARGRRSRSIGRLGGVVRAAMAGLPARAIPRRALFRIRVLARLPAADDTSLGLPRIDAWGCFEFSAFVLRDHSSPLPLDSDSPHPLDRADRLARPPRP